MKFLLRKGHQPDIPCGCPWISMVTLFRISERGQNQITFFLTYYQEMEEIRTLLFVLYSCIHLFIWERQNQTAQKHVVINCILLSRDLKYLAHHLIWSWFMCFLGNVCVFPTQTRTHINELQNLRRWSI